MSESEEKKLTCVINDLQNEAGFAAVTDRRSQPGLPFCVLTLVPDILNVNAYFMTELWE